MQAIARTNRVNEGKNNGLIVDYSGILRHLRQALATFAGAEGAGEGAGTDPARPDEELLADLAEAIALVSFGRNAAIVASKEAANENDQTRKRFEVMCREVFKKFKACINVRGVNAHRAERDAINIVYKKLRQDRDQADISDIIRELHAVVDEAIDTMPARDAESDDISRIDFELLKREFERSPRKNTTTQNLRHVVELRLRRLLEQNPLRTDFQRHYEQIVADYNRDKDQVTIEETFEALLKLVKELDDEESRAVREGLDEKSLAIFDLLKKNELIPADIKRIKAVAVGLLETLKAEKLRVDQWREKEATRDAVRLTIRDFLYSDETGLPLNSYEDGEVKELAEDVFRHVYRVYRGFHRPIMKVQQREQPSIAAHAWSGR